MKNLKSSLYVMALMCVVCIFVPSTVFAQEDGEVPCCNSAQPSPNLETTIEIQTLIILLNVVIETGLPLSMVEANNGTAEIFDGEPTFPLLLPEDSFRSINFRRTYDLMS